MNALVLGAGGFLGLNVVDALREAGVDPLCARRKRSNVIPLRTRRARMVVADLDEPESLDAAMRDVEVVIHAAGYYPRYSLHAERAHAIGVRQTRRVLRAAARARVRRVVYVSSTATVAPAEGRASDEGDVFAAPPGFGTYHDLKWHMEAVARAEADCELAIACPGGCLGPWDLRVGTSALLVGLARGMDPPHPDGVVPLVDARDVARGIVALATAASAPPRVLLSGGNQGIHALLERLADRYGVARPSAPLSADEARALADAEETRAAAGGTRPLLSREIVDLVAHGVPVTAALAERALGLRWTPLDDTLDAFDTWARSLRLIPPHPNSQEPAA